MASCPSRRGASFTLVTVVRRKVGAPFRKVKATCSDWDRLTTSKSLRSGKVSSAWSPLDETVAVIWRFSVPSSATSSASARADTCTSSAASTAEATSKAASALPILLDIRPPLLGLLLPEPPDLEILLSRPQRVEEPLGLAPIHRTVSRRLQFFLLARLARLGLLLRLTLLLLLLSGLLLLSVLLAFLVLPGLLLLVLLLLLRTLLLLLVVLPGLLLLLLLFRSAARLRLLLLALLLAEQQLEVHLGVAILRVELQRARIRGDRLVGPAGLLQRVAEIVGGDGLERRVAFRQPAVRLLHGLRRELGVPRAEQGGGPVVRERRGPRPVLGYDGLLVRLQGALDVACHGARVPLRDVRLGLLHQPAQRAAGPVEQRRPRSGARVGLEHRRRPGDHGRDAQVGAPCGQHPPAGASRQLAQPREIGARQHGAPVPVLLVPGHVPLCGDQGDGLAFLVPHGDRVDVDARVAQLLGGLERGALVVLAVGDEQHRLAGRAAGAAVQYAPGFLQRARDRRPLLGHGAGIDGAQEQLRGAVVGGERALHERLAGEHDQPHAIAAQAIEQRRDLHLRPLQPRRFHVPRQHAGRGIQRHHQIDAAPLHDLGALAALRARRRDREQRQPRAEQAAAQHALGRAAAGQDLLAPPLGT